MSPFYHESRVEGYIESGRLRVHAHKFEYSKGQ